jgi:hypothetical protein
LLPVVTLYTGKLIIVEACCSPARRIQRHVRTWFGSGALDRIGWLLDVFQS